MTNFEKESKNQRPFPYEIEEDQTIKEKHPNLIDLVFVGPKRFCFPLVDKTFATQLYNFKVRPDDVWLFGFQRSGTTLLTEIIWLLDNNFDYNKAAVQRLDQRFPLFEATGYVKQNEEKKNFTTYSDEVLDSAWKTQMETKERRFIKTHLPLSLVPFDLFTSNCKIVYVARNPKDVCVSNYLLFSNVNTCGFNGTFEEYWNCFREGLVWSAPYFEHVKEGWQKRNEENFLFLFYEDLIKDMKKSIGTIADFLGKNVSEDDVNILAEHVNIDNFRKNKSVNNDHLQEMGLYKWKSNNFIRRGVVAKGGEYFQGPIAEEADTWIEENLKKTDIKFI